MFKIIRVKKRVLLLFGLAFVSVFCFSSGILPTKTVQVLASNNQQYTIYLTFDDGPSKQVTPKVLDVLKKHDVDATFFVIGTETDSGIALYRRIIDEGHSIGIHTYSHLYSKIYSSEQGFLEDFNQQADWLRENTDFDTRIYRFPGGSKTIYAPQTLINNVKIQLSQRGYVCYDWDIASEDSCMPILSCGEIYDNVVLQAQKMQGKDLVLLFHDDGVRTTLPVAVEQIIQYFKQQGYNFKSLEKDTKFR